VGDGHTECRDRETKSRLRKLRRDTKTGHDMQGEKHQDGLVTPPARSTMRARCLSHTAGKRPRAFRSFRASFIGINNITAGKAPGFAVASFSHPPTEHSAFFHQPDESEVCGFSFSFVALVSAFTASVRNGPGLYTLAKGVSVWLMVGANTSRGVDHTLQPFVASSALFAVCFDACLHLLYLPTYQVSLTHVTLLARGFPVLTAPICNTRQSLQSPSIA
jgi:hypothetical protein